MFKRIILLVCLFLITLSCVNALNYNGVSEAIQDIVNTYENEGDLLFVVGDNAHFDDTRTALDIAMFLEQEIATSGIIRAGPKKDSEIINPSAQHLILVGGPCANSLTEELSGITCENWPYKDGEGVLMLLENGNKVVVLIAGTTRGDTKRMGKEFENYKTSSKLKSSTKTLFGKAVIAACGNDICETGETDENCREDCSTEDGIQITFDTGKQVSPEIYGDKVVWEDSRNNGIYLYDINTKEEIAIGEGQWPSIYGNYVAYLGIEGVMHPKGELVEWPAIYLYNIKSRENKIIGSAKLANYYIYPSVYKDKVYFQKQDQSHEHWQEPYELDVYDTKTGQTTKLFNTERTGIIPHVYGDTIVYTAPKYCKPEYCLETKKQVGPANFVIEAAEEGDLDIWIYDLITNKKTKITTDIADQYHPQIYDNIIVWEDFRHGDRDVYMYNLDTKQEIRVTSEMHDQIWPSIHKNIITWTDYRNDKSLYKRYNSDIYICDLNKNGQDGGCLEDDEKTRITTNSKPQGVSKIYENKIVWHDNRDSIGSREVCSEGICRVIEDVNIYMYLI